MQKKYIKGDNNTPFEIIEDDNNQQSASSSERRKNLHRYETQLDKLSKATQDTLDKNK